LRGGIPPARVGIDWQALITNNLRDAKLAQNGHKPALPKAKMGTDVLLVRH
jgi:hypothetical protein